MNVTTRYYPTTNYRGSRIRVSWGHDRKFVSYDYGARNAHESAAREVAESWGYVVHSVEYITESESGRGSVYKLDVTEKE